MSSQKVSSTNVYDIEFEACPNQFESEAHKRLHQKDTEAMNFQISTTVTYSRSAVKHWISEIHRIYKRKLRNLYIGFHIEWRPSSDPNNKQPPVAILQLCVGNHCLIFQLCQADAIPRSLFKFLSKPCYTFVGVEVERNAKKLFDDWKLKVSNTKDIGSEATERFGESVYSEAGLKWLALNLGGMKMPEPSHDMLYGNCHWEAKNLNLDQVKYAAIYAFVSYELGMYFHPASIELPEFLEVPPSAKCKEDFLVYPVDKLE